MQLKLKKEKTLRLKKENQTASLGNVIRYFFEERMFQSTLGTPIKYDKGDMVEL